MKKSLKKLLAEYILHSGKYLPLVPQFAVVVTKLVENKGFTQKELKEVVENFHEFLAKEDFQTPEVKEFFTFCREHMKDKEFFDNTVKSIKLSE